MSAAEPADRIIALAQALLATIAEHCDRQTEDGFADALSALVSVTALAISEAGGDVLNHLSGARMASEQLATMILANQTGQLSALYAKAN